MDIVISFFRDTLDGPFYIVWVIFCVILIFACIGYLAEKGIKNKKEKEKYATVSDTNNTEVVQEAVVSDAVNTTQVESTPVTTPIAEPVSNVLVAEEVSTDVTNNTVVTQDNVVSEPEVQPVNSSVIANVDVNTNANPDVNASLGSTVSEVAPVHSQDVIENSVTPVDVSQVANVIPTVEVSQPNEVVTPTVVSKEIQPVTNVDATPSEINNVVIPTINQDGNDNTI